MKHLLIGLLGLGVSLSALGATDVWDPADDSPPGTTLTISTNEQVHGPSSSHTLTNSIDTEDWFNVYLEAGKRYRLETQGAWDTEGHLFSDASGTIEVDYQDYTVGDAGPGKNFQVLYTPAASQTYYLQVTEYNGGPAEYTLHYLEEPALDAWDTADDTHTNATLLDIQTVVSSNGMHKLGPSDTNDWFRFVMVTGAVYTLESSGGWDTSALLYDKELNLIINSRDDFDMYDDAGDETNFKLVYSPTNVGLHYLNVQAYDPGYDISYTLNYHADSDPDSDGEGFSDADEYVAGTDPNDAASYFAITNWSVGSFTLWWPVVSNREYRVYRTSNLTNGFEQIGPVIQYPTNSYTDAGAEPDSFYKVEVQLQ